jgi:pinin
MAAATEKTAEDIRRELQELQRQHREVHLFLCPAHLEAPSLRAVCPDPRVVPSQITERLRDPRGLRRGAPGPGPGPGPPRPLRGFVRPVSFSHAPTHSSFRLIYLCACNTFFSMFMM